MNSTSFFTRVPGERNDGVPENRIPTLLARSTRYEPDDIASIVEKNLRPRPVKKLRGAMDTIFTDITKGLQSEAELDVSYKNEVSMPGILLTSNSKKIQGNQVF